MMKRAMSEMKKTQNNHKERNKEEEEKANVSECL
jgi:hypothetical protein